MFTLKTRVMLTEEVKRSRFVATAAPVEDEEAAKRFIQTVSDSDAGHNCWAYRVGSIQRFNDDGEPGGTAGRPILQAITGQEMTSVAVVVSRWFGGVLLGTGGLVRAYGGTAASCLRLGERVEIIAMETVTVSCGYADEARVRNAIASKSGASITPAGFTAQGVVLDITLAATEADDLVRQITDLTRGQAEITRI